MKRLFLFIFLCVPFFSKADDITLNFVKNKDGNLIMMVNGHTGTIVVKINDQTLTLYREDDRLNLSDMGIESFINELNTQSGQDKKNNVVPPVNVPITPTLSTPF
jgi:hypothetical protein